MLFRICLNVPFLDKDQLSSGSKIFNQSEPLILVILSIIIGVVLQIHAQLNSD